MTYGDGSLYALERLFLWLNSGCNSRCKMCDIWKEPGGTRLSAHEIARMAPEWRRMAVPRVIICGEPLLHPELWDIVDSIRAQGIGIELLSNGYLVPRHAQRIVEGCEVLRISLDGPEQIHNRIRGVRRAFVLVTRAMESIRDVSGTFPVDGRCAVHRYNYRHLRDTVKTAKHLGFRSISFSGTDLYNEEAFRRHGTIGDAYVNDLVIAKDELPELEHQLRVLACDCAAEFGTGFISDSSADLDRVVLQYYRALAGERPFPGVRCNAPWTSAILEYDGSVRPCFPLAAYGRVEGGSFSSALNTSEAKQLRRTLDVKTNAACQHCVCQTELG